MSETNEPKLTREEVLEFRNKRAASMEEQLPFLEIENKYYSLLASIQVSKTKRLEAEMQHYNLIGQLNPEKEEEKTTEAAPKEASE